MTNGMWSEVEMHSWDAMNFPEFELSAGIVYDADFNILSIEGVYDHSRVVYHFFSDVFRDSARWKGNVLGTDTSI